MNKLLVEGAKYLGANESVKRSIIDYYNKHCVQLVKPNRRYRMKYSDNWCACFISVLAHKSGIMVNNFPYEVSVYYMCELAKERNQFITVQDNIKVGDLVIYDWSGRRVGYNHVGIVSNIDGGVLTVLEGNYSNTVGYRRVNIVNNVLRGFILLNRDFNEMDESRIDELAKRAIRGDFGNGRDRVSQLGSDYQRVQDRVNQMLRG